MLCNGTRVCNNILSYQQCLLITAVVIISGSVCVCVYAVFINYIHKVLVFNCFIHFLISFMIKVDCDSQVLDDKIKDKTNIYIPTQFYC